jgi:hypothetical protein
MLATLVTFFVLAISALYICSKITKKAPFPFGTSPTRGRKKENEFLCKIS